MGELETCARLTAACEESRTAAELLEQALPLLVELAEAATGVVLTLDGGALHVVQQASRPGAPALDPAVLVPDADERVVWHRHEGQGVTGVRTPAAWAATGVAAVACQPLPGWSGHLVLAWCDGDRPPPAYDVGVGLVLTRLAGLDAQERLDDLRARVDNAQQLASMGDYDWHVASDTNEWSDQLYRIYGHEPQSFNASYERFLSFIHPDDRAMVTEVHQQAYASGEPYQMVERIVRADGELRYLASNGQVVHDDQGAPVRFRGTCIDITDRVVAEQQRERSRRLFEALVEASPEAILVHDESGGVVSANQRAVGLLGGDPVGARLDGLLDRTRLAGPGGLGSTDATVTGVAGTRLDGGPVLLDVRTATLDVAAPDGGLGAVFLQDAAVRLAGETAAAGLREAQVRRRQALEINDNVVQGLTAALYALEARDVDGAVDLQRRTLASARRMMGELLENLDGAPLRPGDLVRSAASRLAEPDVTVADRPAADAPAAGGPEVPVARQPEGRAGRRPARVLVADDSEDVRLLLCTLLEQDPAIEVVGEAPDGEAAVRLAQELTPDLVLLDLAMPRMDGLQALPLIREATPRTRVVVLSGFDGRSMADRAMAAGADHYVEKGAAISGIRQVVEQVLVAPV